MNKKNNVKPVKSKISKKIGKMTVTCSDCGAKITKIVESRDQLRLKLKGFCESCNKPKMVCVDDVKQIVAAGCKFDYIVRENLPSTAVPGAPVTNTPPSSNTTQQQTPVQPQINQAELNKTIADAVAKLASALNTDPAKLQAAVNDHAKKNQPPTPPTPPTPPNSTTQPAKPVTPTTQVQPATQQPVK